MNILLIGAGGREHTLAWKLRQSSHCDDLYIAPGNAGTALIGKNLDIASTDFEGMKKAAIQYQIEMVVIGPEEPLVNGMVDFFNNSTETRHIHMIGPSKIAAQLEGSKAFAKSFMQRHKIATAAYREFTSGNYEEGLNYIKSHALPIVLKADGLAAGKGVLICESHQEALEEFELILHRSKFGKAGDKVVIESYLAGIEVSVFVLTDGLNYLLLPEAKDYKRIGEGDQGLNTGGMGAVSPLPFFDQALRQKIITRIIEPTIRGLQQDELDYKGFIFFGLMVNKGEPSVIEYNCRLGDPETEVVIPRLKNDLVALLLAVSKQEMKGISIEMDPRAAATVVAVSGGYPGHYEKGKLIRGLQQRQEEDCLVFHSGTLKQGDHTVSNGGRVFAVTGFGKNIPEAARKALDNMSRLDFEAMYFRKDIGHEFS